MLKNMRYNNYTGISVGANMVYPDTAMDLDPANQNFKTGSWIRIPDPTGTLKIKSNIKIVFTTNIFLLIFE